MGAERALRSGGLESFARRVRESRTQRERSVEGVGQWAIVLKDIPIYTFVRPPMGSIADQVSLREITADTVRAVTKLAVTEYQNRFVASNAVSLAQALFTPEAWYRAIYLGDEPVGFVMLEDESLREPIPASPQVGVWRFMVDTKHQRKGVGRAAMLLVIEHVRSKGLFDKLAISHIPDEDGPEQLYLSLGFRPTGEMDEDEVVMELALGYRGKPAAA